MRFGSWAKKITDGVLTRVKEFGYSNSLDPSISEIDFWAMSYVDNWGEDKIQLSEDDHDVSAAIACIATRMALSDIGVRAADCVKMCHSPIERAFLAGAIAHSLLHWEGVYVRTKNPKDMVPEEVFFGRKRPWAATQIIPEINCQEPLGRYRVDFLIKVGSASAIVECDGHDFHERTKEQAARDKKRDRELQMTGLKVFRYTGSEIFQDPAGCGFEVMGHLDSEFRIHCHEKDRQGERGDE